MYRIGMMTEFMADFKDMNTCLKEIKDMGYDCADITFFKAHNTLKPIPCLKSKDYKEKAKNLKAYADSIGLPLVQAHAPFPVYKPNNARYNKNMFALLVRCIEMSGILGLKNLVIHPWNDFTDDENVELYKKLLPFAKQNGVTICSENMWRWDKKIGRTKPCACSFGESFNNILDKVNDENLKACVDIGHAEMFSHMGYSGRKLLEDLGNKKVVCLHIHDNDKIHDTHLIPFTGEIDFADFATGLKNIGYKGDFIVETCLPKNCKRYSEAKKFFKAQLVAMQKFKKLVVE